MDVAVFGEVFDTEVATDWSVLTFVELHPIIKDRKLKIIKTVNEAYVFFIVKFVVTIQNREARVENREGFVVKIEMSCQI